MIGIEVNRYATIQPLNQMAQTAVELAYALGFGSTKATLEQRQGDKLWPQRLEELSAWLYEKNPPCWRE